MKRTVKRTVLTGLLLSCLLLSSAAQDAIDTLRKLAEGGDTKSQVRLGITLASGSGVDADEEAAVFWFRKAAESGDADGQYALGEMLMTGRGVAENLPEAVKWWLKSAEQGNPRANANLAAAYVNGLGVEKDEVKAYKFAKKAADLGEPTGQFALASMLQNGTGVSKDEKEALLWYKRAAEQGDLAATNNLAWLLATSTNPCVRDTPLAVSIASKAAEGSENPAIWDTLARAHYENGEPQKAVAAVKHAIELEPKKSYKETLLKYESKADRPIKIAGKCDKRK